MFRIEICHIIQTCYQTKYIFTPQKRLTKIMDFAAIITSRSSTKKQKQ